MFTQPWSSYVHMEFLHKHNHCAIFIMDGKDKLVHIKREKLHLWKLPATIFGKNNIFTVVKRKMNK